MCPANASWNNQAITVAGFIDGTSSPSTDGLYNPNDLLVDSDGNMHILDAGNNRILYWPVNSNQGYIVAGNGAAHSASEMINAPRCFIGKSSHYFFFIFFC